MSRLLKVSFTGALAVVLLTSVACNQSRSRSVSFTMEGPPDTYTVGKLTLTTDPPSATVSIKIEMDTTVRMSMDGHEAEQINPPDFHHDYEDWAVVGTTPLEDFALATSLSRRTHTSGATAEVEGKIRKFSVRIEKAGYATIELDHVNLRPSGTVLNFDLQPAQPEQVTAAQP